MECNAKGRNGKVVLFSKILSNQNAKKETID